ncbi:hypothetical protein IW261DRAFT_1571143 [Armillaria novae-zelandiae]|uniref:Uncharacterized protein n=1 Tax=Armillaria novae-zelandiae TaxID=153914 RepID=A0AA39NUM1_9AGAR|nr:hypothetical protein IW261DRAFT_1571143 [Armillaria novae-zelandiae]
MSSIFSIRLMSSDTTRSLPPRPTPRLIALTVYRILNDSPPTNTIATSSATPKRALRFPTLGIVSICRDHDRHKTSYCGVCYREATRERDLSRDRVGYTWLACFGERRDRRSGGAGDGGVEGYIDGAQTRMRQFTSLVAANRYETREEGLQQLSAYRAAMRTHESEEDLDMDANDFEEEEEDDPEIKQRSLEDHSGKSMASGYWMGCGYPRETNGYLVRSWRCSHAEHPRPLTRGDEDDTGEERPRQTAIVDDELRALLLPPMKNIVRILVIECAADGYDADEDLDYDSYYDEEFYSEEDDEAWSPSADRKSPEVPGLPITKRSLDGVTEPMRSGTPPTKLQVDVESFRTALGGLYIRRQDLLLASLVPPSTLPANPFPATPHLSSSPKTTDDIHAQLLALAESLAKDFKQHKQRSKTEAVIESPPMPLENEWWSLELGTTAPGRRCTIDGILKTFYSFSHMCMRVGD